MKKTFYFDDEGCLCIPYDGVDACPICGAGTICDTTEWNWVGEWCSVPFTCGHGKLYSEREYKDDCEFRQETGESISVKVIIRLYLYLLEESGFIHDESLDGLSLAEYARKEADNG